MASAPAKIGVLSIGDMGMGIAKLLVANGFAVATNGKGRSDDTIARAKSASVEVLSSDVELTDACSVILSVVPPRDAAATAQRLVDAMVGVTTRPAPLYFADLNAVAPSTCRAISAAIEQARVPIRFVDGAIIGGPPKAREEAEPEAPPPPPPGNAGAEGTSAAVGRRWHRPSIPTSGPHKLSDIPGFGARLFDTLNMRHIGPDVGAASGLKMCFASTTKGFTAIAIQSFTTAHRLGVLDELRRELETATPAALRSAERGVVAMAPKAYRWVREMEEIALTFQEDGGFAPDTFEGIAKVYKAVADDSELGREKVGKRKRGTTVEDMATVLAEGMDKRKKKNV